MSTQRPDMGPAIAHATMTDAEADATGAPELARAVYRGRLEWMDTDAGGHHHNTSITRFVEAAEATLMRETTRCCGPRGRRAR